MRIALLTLFFIPVIVNAGIFEFGNTYYNGETASARILGDINIRPLDQFTATTSPADAITQRIFGKSLRLTGYSAGCIEASSNGTLTSTGSSCGSGGGGSSFGQAWEMYGNPTYLAPTTTIGFIVNASSTISALTIRNGTTTNATTTNSYDSGTTRIQSLSGLLKGTTGLVSVASAGTDYQLPLTADVDYLTPTTAATTYVPYSGATGGVNLNAQTLYGVGGLRTSDGSNITPAYSFTTETNTGMYLGGVGSLNFAIAGVDQLTVTGSTVTIPSTLTLSAISDGCLQSVTGVVNSTGVSCLSLQTVLTSINQSKWATTSADTRFIQPAGGLGIISTMSTTTYSTTTTASFTNASTTNLVVSGLTGTASSGRIPLVGAGGVIFDSASFVWGGTPDFNVYNSAVGGRSFFRVGPQGSSANAFFVMNNTGYSAGANTELLRPLAGAMGADTGSTGGWSIIAAANAPITFGTGGYADTNERMRVTGTGNVGIGSSSPYSLLAVNAKSSNYNATIFSIASSTAAFATTTHMVVLANGYVGIGTTSPYSALSVVGTTTAQNFVATSTTATSTFSGGLVVRNGDILPTYDRSFNFASSSLAYDGAYSGSGTTTKLLANPSAHTTLVKFYCKTDKGTVHVAFGNGTATTTDANCSTSGVEITPTTNNTWSARQNFFVEIGRQATTPNEVVITATLKNTAN